MPTSTRVPNYSAQLSARLKKSADRCTFQMAAYGACVQASMPDIVKGVCQKEIEALKSCVFAKK